MKYRVLFERTVRSEQSVEASSYEEAVAIAKKEKPSLHVSDMVPTWVGTETELEETGEYEYEVIGTCALCKMPIVARDLTPSLPWLYGLTDEGETVCYKCLTDTKETPCPPTDP